MISPRLTHVLAASALATTLAGGIVAPAQAMPLPVTSAHEIAGAAPTEHVHGGVGVEPGGAATAGAGAGPITAAEHSRLVSLVAWRSEHSQLVD